MPSPTTPRYVPYTDAVETPPADEAETSRQIDEAMTQISRAMEDRFRHSIRSVHAKSHGLLKATLAVADDLPAELRQGLFARPGRSYPAIVRFSTNPGDILPDTITTPRGMAVKVLGVEGEMLPENAGNTTQDFVFASGKQFQAKDAKGFLQNQKPIVAHAYDDPLTKEVVSGVARGVNAALAKVGLETPQLEGLGAPKTHLLANTFGSQAPIRYGDYFGKLVIAPRSENMKALEEHKFHTRGHYSAIKEDVQEFFRAETAVWDVQVQLCTDLDRMPVEDAAQEWPEDESPYVTVATLTAGPQETYSAARRVYVDDRLSFNPWHALAAHRPLGGIMRARQAAYATARKLRSTGNAVEIQEPTEIGELPE